MTDQSNTPLEPCPFCGGAPELHGYHAPEFWVWCPTIGCRAQTEGFGSKDRAIAAWNRRATQPSGEWQDIASAPTNKALQVWIPDADYYGSDGVYAAMLVDMGTGRRWMTFGWAIGRHLPADTQPTHWMPLPAPPTPKGLKAGDREEGDANPA